MGLIEDHEKASTSRLKVLGERSKYIKDRS